MQKRHIFRRKTLILAGPNYIDVWPRGKKLYWKKQFWKHVLPSIMPALAVPIAPLPQVGGQVSVFQQAANKAREAQERRAKKVAREARIEKLRKSERATLLRGKARRVAERKRIEREVGEEKKEFVDLDDFKRNELDVGRDINTLTININDYGTVRRRAEAQIRSFLNTFAGRRILIIGEITGENGEKTDTDAEIQHKKVVNLTSDIKKFLAELLAHIDWYERIWSDPDVGKEVKVTKIIIRVRVINNSKPPAVAMSTDNINCLLRCIYDQTKRKKVLKETFESKFISCWDYLEDKYQCRITILDYEDDIWRKSDKVIPRKKYQPDVIIKLHNYHVESISTRERKFIFNKIKSIEADQRLIDGIWHAKRKKVKNTELQDKSFSNVMLRTINKSKPKKFKNIWITMDTMEKLYIKLSRSKYPPFVIETQDNIIGLIDRSTSAESTSSVSLHYKTKCAFRDMNEDIIDYDSTSAWSLSSFIRNKFRKFLIDNSVNVDALQQIPNEDIYRLTAASHMPIGRVFNRRLYADKQIQQIDMNRSYRNCADHLPDHLKKYWHDFPTAPRSVKNHDTELTVDIMNDMFNNRYGNVIIEYDQSNLNIPTWFDGHCRKKGVQYVSIPALKYMFDKGIHIKLIQEHYAEKNCKPFEKFFNILDKDLELLCMDKSEQGEKNYNNYRMLPNMLIGGLNRKMNKTNIFRTYSKEEFDRFIIKSAEKNRLITKLDTKELNDYDDKVPEDCDFDGFFAVREGCPAQKIEEYIIHYQETENMHFDNFNMVHWSKYVLDYQKIVMHDTTVRVCRDNIDNLGCINTDSITYVGDPLYKMVRGLHPPTIPPLPSAKTKRDVTAAFADISVKRGASKRSIDINNYFHPEASNMDEGILVSNGIRYLCDKKGHTLQRHSGYDHPLEKKEFIKLLDFIDDRPLYDDDNTNFTIPTIEVYDIKTQNIKLNGQKLVRTIAQAGFGKSEIVKWMTAEESKFDGDNHLLPQTIYRKYKPNEVLCAAPTHQARKILGGDTITCMGLRFSLEFYANSKLDVSKLKAIIFDEVSMMDRHEFEKLDTYLRDNLKNRPFGGLDVYLFGDFKQLPPYKGKIVKPEDMLFKSKLYDMFEASILTKNYRQQNQPILCSILDKIRKYYKYGGDELSTRNAGKVLPRILTEEEMTALNGATPPLNCIPLCHSNKKRQEENERIHGKLRIKSRIIFRKSFKAKNIFNGDEGIIEDIRELGPSDAIGQDHEYLIRTDNGISSYWFPSKYFKEPRNNSTSVESLAADNDETSSKKYPDIHLNYATTVYCSQGKTLDSASMDLSKLSINLAYVAISRVKNINNIYCS